MDGSRTYLTRPLVVGVVTHSLLLPGGKHLLWPWYTYIDIGLIKDILYKVCI